MSLRTLARCLTVVTMLLCAAPMVQVAQAADKSRMAVTLAQQASKSFETGDFARASELYLAAWRTDPNPDFLFGAARSAHLGGITDKATELYRQFLGTEGADGERKRRAQEYLNELDRAKVQSRVAEAERVAREDPKLAAGLYLDAFKMSPKQFELLFKAAVAEQQAQDTTSAEQHLQEYLAAAPNDAPDRNQAQARLDSILRKSNPAPEKPDPTPVVRQDDPPPAPKPPLVVAQPAEPGRPRWPGWAMVGGGGAVMIAGLAIYGATAGDASTLKAALTPNEDGQVTAISQEEAARQASSINARVGAGWALAGVGAAAVGVGVWWLLTTPEEGKTAASTRSASGNVHPESTTDRVVPPAMAWSVGPGPGAAGVSMALRF